MSSSAFPLDPLDRLIVLATQDGLPRVARPYHAIAEQVGAAPAEVMARLQRMLENGVIRRIGAVPNHYALGYKANGMTVWDVADERVDALGERVGQLESVSHCYQRPIFGDWPYGVYTMIHGGTAPECEEVVNRMQTELGQFDHLNLYSTKEYKKIRLKYFTDELHNWWSKNGARVPKTAAPAV